MKSYEASGKEPITMVTGLIAKEKNTKDGSQGMCVWIILISV